MGSPAELVAHLPDDSPFMNTLYTLQSPLWTLHGQFCALHIHNGAFIDTLEQLGASEAERRSWLPGSG